MANVAPVVTIAVSAINISNMARMRSMQAKGMQEEKSEKKAKKKKVVKIPAILKEKFDETWDCQEERLSKLKITLADTYRYTKYDDFKTGEDIYVYENGNMARVNIIDEPDGNRVERYDEQGNCIERDGIKCIYYPEANQKEFEWSEVGIRHFNKNGKEDTERYLAKIQMASKRIEEEKKTGVTLRKMSKVEKAVARVFKDKPEMTVVEKMLARKARRSREE